MQTLFTKEEISMFLEGNKMTIHPKYSGALELIFAGAGAAAGALKGPAIMDFFNEAYLHSARIAEDLCSDKLILIRIGCAGVGLLAGYLVGKAIGSPIDHYLHQKELRTHFDRVDEQRGFMSAKAIGERARMSDADRQERSGKPKLQESD